MDRWEWQLPGDPGASLALGMVQHEGEALLHAAWWVTGTNWVLQDCVNGKHPVLLAQGEGYLCPIPGRIHGWGFSAVRPRMPPSMAGTLNIPSIYFP